MTTIPASTANRTRTWLRVGVGGGLAVALVSIVAGFLWFRVCDEQATSSGQIIEVCRHMAATDPPIVVLGVLTLVLLSTFYAEISGFGIPTPPTPRPGRRRIPESLISPSSTTR